VQGGGGGRVEAVEEGTELAVEVVEAAVGEE
jgi:hypothetical protein